MKNEIERLRWLLAQTKKGFRKVKTGQNHLLYLDKIKQIEGELVALQKTDGTNENEKVPKLLRSLWTNVSELHICAKGGNFPVEPGNDLVEDFKKNLKEILPDYELIKTEEKPLENTIETNENDSKKTSIIRERLNRGSKINGR